MAMKVYYYPTCNTCKKAMKWLDEKGIPYSKKHIVDSNLTYKEVEEIYKKSKLDVQKLFNTSGLVIFFILLLVPVAISRNSEKNKTGRTPHIGRISRRRCGNWGNCTAELRGKNLQKTTRCLKSRNGLCTVSGEIANAISV